jgi:hypothetical protein
MKKLAIISSLFVVMFVHVSLAFANDFDSLKTLKILLGDNLTFKETVTHKVIEYCPDNTCNLIKSPKSVPTQTLSDFAFLYIFYASGYIYIKKPYDDSVPFLESGKKIIPHIIARNEKGCNNSSDLKNISCILLSMYKSSNIKLYFSRFDEGQDSVSLINHKEELSTESLVKTKKWLDSQ